MQVLVLLILLLLLFLGYCRINAHTMAAATQVLRFAQTLAVLRTYDLLWPRPFITVLDWFTVFGFRIDMFRPDCFVHFTVYNRNMFVFSSVIWSTGFYGVLYQLLRKLGLVTVAEKGLYIRSAVTMSGFVYLPVTMSALQFFICQEQLDGEFVMLQAPPELCYTSKWWRFFPVYLIALIFVIAYPVGVFVFLLKSKHKLARPEFKLAFGPLYLRFKGWVPLNACILVFVQ